MNKEKLIYNTIVNCCEILERTDAEFLARKITNAVIGALLPKHQRVIYDSLISLPQSTKAIADQLGLKSKYVSAQLKQIAEKTSNILYATKSNGDKIWYLKP